MAKKNGLGGWIHNGVVVVTTTIILLLLACEFTNTIDIIRNWP